MKHQADMVLGLPIHVLPHFRNGLLQGVQESCLIVVRSDRSGDIRKVVIAIAAKYRSNSDVAFAAAQPTFRDVGTPQAYDKLVRDGWVRLKKPGNPVQFCISSQRHVIEGVL